METDGLPAEPHPRNAGTRALPWIALALAALGGAGGFLEATRKHAFLQPDETIAVPGLSNLSGLAWLEGPAILMGVTDEGRVAGIRWDGSLHDLREYPWHDFEDVVADPSGRSLWLLEERRGLMRLQLDDGRIVEERGLAPLGAASVNRGYEGLSAGADPASWLVASEMHPAGWTAVGPNGGLLGPARIASPPSLSAIVLAPDRRRVLLVSRERGIMVATVDGAALTPWRRVGAAGIEGAALVPGRGLVLCSDRKESKLFVFRGLDDWDRLEEACRARA